MTLSMASERVLQQRVLTVLLGVALAPCTAAGAQSVKTDYDHKTDFSRYHTYSLYKVQTDNPLNVQRVKDAVNKELSGKSLQEVPSGGDIAITAIGSAKDEQQYNTFYSGLGSGGYGWGGWGGWGGRRWGGGGLDTGTTQTSVQQIPVGTLVLDMYDNSTHQLVWRGSARADLSKDADKNIKKLNKAVNKMFDKFPPKSPQ